MHHETEPIDFLQDDSLFFKKKIISRKIIITLIVLIFLLSFFNAIIAIISLPENISDEIIGFSNERIILSIATEVFVVIPVLSFTLSFAFSFISYKGYSYKEKYLPFALCILLMLQILVFLLLISDSI